MPKAGFPFVDVVYPHPPLPTARFCAPGGAHTGAVQEQGLGETQRRLAAASAAQGGRRCRRRDGWPHAIDGRFDRPRGGAAFLSRAGVVEGRARGLAGARAAVRDGGRHMGDAAGIASQHEDARANEQAESQAEGCSAGK